MKRKMLSRSMMGMGIVAYSLAASSANHAAMAVDFSFRGNFAQDDEVQLFDFSVGALSNVTLRSYSYAGGTQADGTTVTAGGFDPILTLFDAAGNLISRNDDAPSGTVLRDAATGYAFDVLLNAALDPGDYTVAITQFGNALEGTTLAEGFKQVGQGNYTADICGGATPFRVTGYRNCAARTSAWAFDILNVSDAVVVPPVTDPVVNPAVNPGLTPPPASTATNSTGTPTPSAASTSVPEPSTTVAIAALAGTSYLTRRRQQHRLT